jgi:hypothetical protein
MRSAFEPASIAPRKVLPGGMQLQASTLDTSERADLRPDPGRQTA